MKILKSYYEHISQNPKTHIIKFIFILFFKLLMQFFRFFGLHKMRFKLSNSIRPKKLYIIIMSNVFHTSKEIHERYDLKGSTYKRKTKEKYYFKLKSNF